jgi:hypothetical protein
LEEDTNAFDVGTEPCADDDEVAVLDDAVFAVKPVVGADLAVELVDDCDRDVVAVGDPPAV